MHVATPDANTILECLSHNWLQVVTWAASSAVAVAGVAAAVVAFVMNAQVRFLEAQIKSLENSGDRIGDLNKTIAEHWKTLYEDCKANRAATKAPNRMFAIFCLVLLGIAGGALLTGFGARLYFAGPIGDLQTQLRTEKLQNTALTNTLDQLKTVLPSKAFEPAADRTVNSAKSLNINVPAPAGLIDAAGSRYKLVAEKGQRLHVVVQPVAIRPQDKGKLSIPEASGEN